MRDFVEASKGLAKNPLGIIALFITLIYGFACLVLNNTSLEASLQIILIWFLVLFPELVMGIFVYLVVWHHEKLYAPGDFKDEKNFFKATSPEKIDQQLNDEVNQELDSKSEEEMINQQTVKEEKCSCEVNENNDVKEDNIYCMSKATMIKQQYMKIESQVIKKIEEKKKIEIIRNVDIFVSEKEKIEVDGVSEEGRQVCIFEVKYIRNGALNNRVIEKLGCIIERINNSIYLKKRTHKIVIAIVCKSEFKVMIQQQVETCFSNFENVEFEIFTTEELE